MLCNQNNENIGFDKKLKTFDLINLMKIFDLITIMRIFS
jgi:hypothetical protein